jgi:hypothetical protein
MIRWPVYHGVCPIRRAASITDAEGVSRILILSDINAGMSGLELLPKAKALRANVPVISDHPILYTAGPLKVRLLVFVRRGRFHLCTRAAFRNWIYFSANFPSRAGNGAPQSRWVIS